MPLHSCVYSPVKDSQSVGSSGFGAVPPRQARKRICRMRTRPGTWQVRQGGSLGVAATAAAASLDPSSHWAAAPPWHPHPPRAAAWQAALVNGRLQVWPMKASAKDPKNASFVDVV